MIALLKFFGYSLIMPKYKILKNFIIIFIFAGVMSNGLSFSEKSSRELLLIYSGNTLGELKPCGCTKEEDQGGFERRATYFNQAFLSTKNILLVDTGDSFKEPTLQGKIKANYIMQAMSKLKYDVLIPGDKDLIYGESFLNNNKSIPWLLSNAKLKGIELPKRKIKTFENGLTAAILGIVDPELYYSIKHSGGQFSDQKITAQKLIKKIKASEKPDLIVLLTHMKREKAISLLKLDGVDIIINGHIEKDTDIIDMAAVKKGEKIFIQPGPRGQKMGELTIHINSLGNKSFEQRIIRLDSKIKFDPEMGKWYQKYNQEVEDLFFASMDTRKNQNKKKKTYATEKICLTCHSNTHKTWSMSRHSHAYETLNRVNKTFDPECLKCHVTGLDRIGGFVSEADTPELKNVQCEACHGPGLDHSKQLQTKFKTNAKNACELCHNKTHSPNFNYLKYWPKIKH